MKGKYTILFWVLLFSLLVIKLVYIGWGPLDLAPDEAHYWDWSRHLDLSYYSKGPFIAYENYVGSWLGRVTKFQPPNPAFWVRFSAVTNSTLLGIIVWLLANRLWQEKRISFSVVLILAAIPVYTIGSILMTIDNPLMLFWALYAWCVFLALDTEKGIYWYLSGIAWGLGFLSKYTMIILIPCIVLYLLTSLPHRYWLRKKQFYLSLLIAFLFFLPILIWNFKYNWIGIRHLLGQAGLHTEALRKSFFSGNTSEFIGIQLGIISPLIFILIILAFSKAWKQRTDWRYNYLLYLGVPLGVLYLALSLHKPCQPNWPVPAYFAGVLLAGKFFARKKILKFGILLGILIWVSVFLLDLFPAIPDKLDPTIRLRGWKELGREVGKISKDSQKQRPIFICSDRYQITSELAFYVPGQPSVYCFNTGRRMNQYDLWQDFSKLVGFDAVYVKHRDQDLEPEVADSFQSHEKLLLIEIKKGERIIDKYSVFICRNFKGITEKKDEITY